MIRELNLLDRFLWCLVVLAFLALASVLTWDTWTQWQKNQVKDMPRVFIHHLHLGGDHSKGHDQAGHRLTFSRHNYLCFWTTHGQCAKKVEGQLPEMESREPKELKHNGGNERGQERVHAENLSDKT